MIPPVRFSLAVVAAVGTLVSCSCGGSGGVAGNLGDGFQPLLEDLSRASDSRAVALVRTKAGDWHGAAGYEEGTSSDSADEFAIASTTKTFVATVVLQVADEGNLSLEDSVARWLPRRVRAGRRITIRQLLNHTSGLPRDGSVPGGIGEAQPRLLFRPGTRHSYSNLGYDLLGLIVERATNRPIDRQIDDRIVRPLALKDTHYGVTGAGAQRTGGIVSSTRDLARFFGALLAGEVISDDLLVAMTKTVATGSEFHAGLGLFRAELPCGSAWGHGGAQPDSSNQVLASRDGSTAVVVAQNTMNWPSVKEKAEEMYCRALNGSRNPRPADGAAKRAGKWARLDSDTPANRLFLTTR